MRSFSFNSNDPSGGSAYQSSRAVPTGMENDPNADETVINQQADGPSPREKYPHPVEEEPAQTQTGKIAPDDLADSIAYALDGSGPGPTNDTPNVSGDQKVITEGITGAGLDEEEEALRG